jgi:phosphohistidine phosphatase SixA
MPRNTATHSVRMYPACTVSEPQILQQCTTEVKVSLVSKDDYFQDAAAVANAVQHLHSKFLLTGHRPVAELTLSASCIRTALTDSENLLRR